jgi:hypothetical protein
MNRHLTYGITVDIWSFGVFAVELAKRKPLNDHIKKDSKLITALLKPKQPIIDLEALTNGSWSPLFN